MKLVDRTFTATLDVNTYDLQEHFQDKRIPISHKTVQWMKKVDEQVRTFR